jgi:tRNA-Thr(GGU) m(6)t(6)A37 methyltransferase TsaA
MVRQTAQTRSGILPESVSSDDYTVRPVGFVRSTLRNRADAPKQAREGAPEAVLELEPEFAPALHLVQPGDDLILLTWLHLADRSVLQTHPRDDPSAPLTGVFATRSSDRPNPIGLHRVTVLEIESPTRLRVSALEAIDGTPILDLKTVLTSSPGE